MPSGAYVTVQLWLWGGQSKYYMDVTVYPISEDRNHGSGLCGNYNGDPSDDLTPAGSNVPDNGLTSGYHLPLLFPPSYMYVLLVAY